MRQILETEDHVVTPPMMYWDPFYRITHLIKAEIRKHKWIEGKKAEFYPGSKPWLSGPLRTVSRTKNS